MFSWAIGRILEELKKRVRIIHSKRAIRVRAIEVILYIYKWRCPWYTRPQSRSTALPRLRKKTKWGTNNYKKVRDKSRECHNHKPQPFQDIKRKRKPTNLNKHKPNKRTKSTKISSLFPKRGNRNTKRTGKHKNKMTHGKTYNKSPRRINHKATRSKTNTGTTALQSTKSTLNIKPHMHKQRRVATDESPWNCQ